LSLGAARTGPGISLLPSGSIWLSWSTDHDQIGLVLLRDGSLAAGIVSREAARPTRINFSGQFSAVLQRIENEPLAHWITARQNLPP
jgi:hypothetical protein